MCFICNFDLSSDYVTRQKTFANTCHKSANKLCILVTLLKSTLQLKARTRRCIHMFSRGLHYFMSVVICQAVLRNKRFHMSSYPTMRNNTFHMSLHCLYFNAYYSHHERLPYTEFKGIHYNIA